MNIKEKYIKMLCEIDMESWEILKLIGDELFRKKINITKKNLYLNTNEILDAINRDCLSVPINLISNNDTEINKDNLHFDIRPYCGKNQFYNLKNDPTELNNLINKKSLNNKDLFIILKTISFGDGANYTLNS